MIDKIDTICSGCSKKSKTPEYSKYGLPYQFLRCECGAETELNPRRTNSKWWESVWMELVSTTRKEFRDAVADRLVEFIIDRRNYVRDREYCNDSFEPQSLEKKLGVPNKEEVIEATKEMGHLIQEKVGE